MNKKTSTQSKGRMIHIRLNEETHKRLKIKAVHQDTTVQNLVERLILDSLAKSQSAEAGND